MRNLASIQRITAITPIENANAIETASVLGWKVVVKKDEFKVGDLCLFFEVDSILPKLPEFNFLEKYHYRLKTVRMRGQLSQGLCVHLDTVLSLSDQYREALKWSRGLIDRSQHSTLHILERFHLVYTLLRQTDIRHAEGLDITNTLDIQKYEEPFPEEMLGKSKGFHPKVVRKTGEVRVQAYPDLLQEFQNKTVVVLTKIEGVSSSYITHNGEIDICSHTHSLLEDENSVQWQMVKKHDILWILKQHENIAIQGEVAGPGIFGNPMGLSEKRLFVFRMFDTDTNRRWSVQETLDFCNEHGLEFVPFTVISNFNLNLEQVLELAKGDYRPSGTPREGIVLTPADPIYSETLCDWLSMKVINNDYLTGEWKKNRKGV